MTESSENNITFNNVSIQGKKLFSTEEEMNAHVPGQVKQRFLEIMDTISSLEAFNVKTNLDYLLRLDFTMDMTNDQRTNISRFFSDMPAMNKCVNTSGSSSDFFAWDNLMGNSIRDVMYSAIMKNMEEDVDRIDSTDVKPLSHGVSHSDYKLVIKNLCTNIFKRHFLDLQRVFEDNLMVVSEKNLEEYSSILCEHVRLNSDHTLDYFDRNCAITDAETYYKDAYNHIIDMESNYSAISIPFKKLFMACFYPYFVFEFLMNNIATKEQDSMDSAPRFFFVHRITVLGGYMFLFYTLVTIIDQLGSSKLQSDYGRAFTLMAKINDNLFVQENMTNDQTLGYTDLQQQTQDTRALATELQNMTHDIIKIRSNLNKAAMNDALLLPQVAKSKTRKYIWLAFSLAAIVALFVMLFFSGFKMVNQAFYALSTLVVLVIGLALLIRFFVITRM